MMRKSILVNYTVNIILCILTSFSMVYALTSTLNFHDYTPAVILKYISVMTAVFAIVFYNKLSFISSIAIAAISLPIAFLKSEGNARLVSIPGIQEYISWMEGYTAGYYLLDKTYEAFTVFLLCFFITIAVYVLTCKWHDIFGVLVGGTALFVCQWILDYFVSYLSFFIYLFVIVVYYFRFVHLRRFKKKNNEYSDSALFSLNVMPVSLIILLTAAVIPAKKEPLNISWLTKNVNRIVNYVNERVFINDQNQYFSISSSGFGDGSLLGGSVNTDKTHVLSVKSPRPLYLKAVTCSTYTGYSWKGSSQWNPYTNGSGILNDDLEEMKTGLWVLTGEDEEYLEKYLNDNEVEVTFENLRTKSVFIPLYTYDIEIPNGTHELRINETGILSVDKIARKGFKYNLKAYSPKYADQSFANIVRKSRQGFYDQLIEQINKDSSIYVLAKDMPGNPVLLMQNLSDGLTRITNVKVNDTFENIKNSLKNNGFNLIVVDKNLISIDGLFKYFTFSNKIDVSINLKEAEKPLKVYQIDELYKLKKKIMMYAEKAEQIRAMYLQLPDTFPESVKELASAITSGYDNDFDKAKAIEQFLSKTDYTYTLSPPATPRGRDFVEYFLFDLKKGYCTYYASAMVMLLRSIGIPARYVEGYVLPSRPGSNSTYNVTNERAHAWAEAYFEGIGWLQFEPTPQYNSILYRDENAEQTYSTSMNYNLQMFDYYRNRDIYDMNDEPPVNGTLPAIQDEDNLHVYIRYLILAAVLTLLILSVITTNSVRHRIIFFRAKRANPKACVLDLYKYYLRILSGMKLEFKPGETPYQFSERVDLYLLFSKPVTFRTITDIFIKARYGNTEISKDESTLVYDFYPKLKDKTMHELGRFIYFIKMYILGRL